MLTQQLLSLGDRPTAIFAYNDRMAMGVYRALAERRLAIPHDVSVIGFDDQNPIAVSLYPGLTTVGLPHYDMGAWAVNTLAEILGADSGGGPPSDGTTSEWPLRMECRLVERESVASIVGTRALGFIARYQSSLVLPNWPPTSSRV